MNYSHLELILAIADAGSISEAAENLFVSQPFLSSSLKRIEDEIGTPLFRRSKLGVEPTPFGHEYLTRARQISDQINTLSNLYKDNQVPHLELNIGSMGFCFLYPALSILCDKYREIPCSFHIRETSLRQQTLDINRGLYELGFSVVDQFSRKYALQSIKNKGLEYSRLHPVTPGIYVSPHSKHFPAHITQLDEASIRYLDDMPYISIHSVSEDVHTFEYWPALNALVKRRNTRFIAGNISIRSQMIGQYDGFTTAAYCAPLYDRFPFTEPMRFIPFAPERQFGWEIGWIQRENHPRSPLANELIRLLSE